MNLRTLAYRMLGQRNLQRASERFWLHRNDTYVAPAAHYETREREIGTLLGSLPSMGSALDQGCGDGHLTAVVARHVGKVNTYDISPTLINFAKARNLSNAGFEVGELEATQPGHHDIVTCMGVANLIVDDKKYATVIYRLKESVLCDGYLLLVDNIRKAGTVVKAQKHGYIGKYRNATQYASQIASRGMRLLMNESSPNGVTIYTT